MPKRKIHEFLSYSQDVLLCQLVCQNPSLYDTEHPDYKEVIQRERVWDSISDQMNLPVDACKSRWRNIRDSYKRSRRERIERHDTHLRVRPKKRYTLAEHLGFLEKIFLDDDKRSNSLTSQGEIIDGDGDQMTPSIEMILDAANVVNDFSQGVKQEKEDADDDNKGEENGNSEREEIIGQHFSDLYPAEGLIITNVSSTSNVDEGCGESYHYKNSIRRNATKKNRSSPRRRGLGRGRLLKRNLAKRNDPSLHLRQKRKTHSEDFAHFMIQEQVSHIPHVQLQSPEDETDLFFQSMALSAKVLHPVILAELKKKVCAVVMDSVIENEKFVAKLQSQVFYSTKDSSSGLESNDQQQEENNSIVGQN